jgi:hypothetical protein
MSNKPSDQDNFYDWMLATNAEEARLLTAKCQCGVDATYKGKKDFDTTYMHSYYCAKYQERPKDGEQEKRRK